MIDLLIYVAVLVIVVCLIWWLLSQLPLPEPARKIVTIVLVVIVAVVAIGILMNMMGGGGLRLPR